MNLFDAAHVFPRARINLYNLAALDEQRNANHRPCRQCCGLDAAARRIALHAWLGRGGECITGRPTCLLTDTDGAWLCTEPCDSAQLLGDELQQLTDAHAVAARALTAAGYFGPFAIDAFRWRDDAGRRHFQPVSELNARFTMGFFVGFADLQDDWLTRIS